MKVRAPAAAIIFLGSYLPLSLILLAQNYDYSYLHHSICLNLLETNHSCVIPLKNPTFAIGIFLICSSCLLATLLTLRLVAPKQVIVVTSCKYVPAQLMNYVLPYVVSLISVDYQDTGKFVSLAIFLSWMYWITYKSGQIILNPILTVFNWRLYEVSYRFPAATVEHSGLLLSKETIAETKAYRQVTIQDVLIVNQHDGSGESRNG